MVPGAHEYIYSCAPGGIHVRNQYLFIHRLLNKSNETMLEFRALAERVRVCQERLEKQEQALEDVSHVIHTCT